MYHHFGIDVLRKFAQIFFLWRYSRLIFEVSRSHTDTRARPHTHGKTPLNEWSTCRRGLCLPNTQRTCLHSAGFEPSFPAVKLLQIYVLDRMDNGMALSFNLELKYAFLRLRTYPNTLVSAESCVSAVTGKTTADY